MTTFFGEGVNGPVQQLSLVVPRRRRQALLDRVYPIDPNAFITVEATSNTYGGYHAWPVRDHNK